MSTRSPAGSLRTIIAGGLQAIFKLALPLAMCASAACVSRSGFEGGGNLLDLDPTCEVEVCNGVDDDCDGLADEGCDTSCGSLSSFHDDFDDQVTGTAWDRTMTNGVLLETGGALELRPSASTGSVAYRSNEGLLVRGGEVAIEVTGMVDVTTTARFTLGLIRSNAGFVNIRQTAGELLVEMGTTSGGFTPVISMPYDPVAQRWWRLVFDATPGSREGAAEVSPDGRAWTQLTTFTAPFPADLVHVSLAADAAGAVEPGFVRVDTFNGPGSGDFSNCSIAGLQDDFNDDEIGALWDKSFADGGSTLTEAAGEVVLTPPVNGSGGVGLYSTNRYDLRNASITARVTQVLSHSTSTENVFRVISGTHEGFFLVRNNRLVALLAQEGSNVLADVPYDPTQHRCWRFRESAGDLNWEVAGGACASFTTLATMAVASELSSVSVIVFAQAFTPMPAPGSMHVDSITIP